MDSSANVTPKQKKKKNKHKHKKNSKKQANLERPDYEKKFEPYRIQAQTAQVTEAKKVPKSSKWS